MTFGEKLRIARKSKKMTQLDLAKAAGISLKTVTNYEAGATYPHNRSFYKVLADILEVDEYYLYNENNAFVDAATSVYGAKGRKEAEALVAEVGGLFAGGTLSESEMDGVMRALQDVYWKCKELNREKYGKNKED